MSAVLAMVVFSFECSMHVDLNWTFCGGNKGDWDLRFLIVLSHEMLEDKQCLSVGIFDRLHFRHILCCILCVICIINYCYSCLFMFLCFFGVLGGVWVIREVLELLLWISVENCISAWPRQSWRVFDQLWPRALGRVQDCWALVFETFWTCFEGS